MSGRKGTRYSIRHKPETAREWLLNRITEAQLRRLDADILDNFVPRAELAVRFDVSTPWVLRRAREIGAPLQNNATHGRSDPRRKPGAASAPDIRVWTSGSCWAGPEWSETEQSEGAWHQ